MDRVFVHSRINAVSGWLVLPLWEYKIADFDDTKFELEIKGYGNAGWELVFARRALMEDAPRNASGELLKTPEKRGVYECIFKRRLTVRTLLKRL